MSNRSHNLLRSEIPEIPSRIPIPFRALSDEITIFEIKAPPASASSGIHRPSSNHSHSNMNLSHHHHHHHQNHHLSHLNHRQQIELSSFFANNPNLTIDNSHSMLMDNDDENETRMDAALMLETELFEDLDDDDDGMNSTTIEPIQNMHVVDEIEVSPEISINSINQIDHRASSVTLPKPIPSIRVNNTNVNVNVSSNLREKRNVTYNHTVHNTNNDNNKLKMLGTNQNANSLDMTQRRRRRKSNPTPRTEFPSTSANDISNTNTTSISVNSAYRTRTVVRNSLAAAQKKLQPTEVAEKPKMTTRLSSKPPLSISQTSSTAKKVKSMKEVLASIPGFGAGRPRKRHNRKLSTAEQLEQTKKEGYVDLETPGSILTNVNLREILNIHTFSNLPPLYQYKLIQLLPEVDFSTLHDNSLKITNSALNNEFFAKAQTEWLAKLNVGEFTSEARQRNKMEAEKEKLKLDPWKVKHFEPIWGEKSNSNNSSSANTNTSLNEKTKARSAVAVDSNTNNEKQKDTVSVSETKVEKKVPKLGLKNENKILQPPRHNHDLRRSPLRSTRLSPYITPLSLNSTDTDARSSAPSRTSSAHALAVAVSKVEEAKRALEKMKRLSKLREEENEEDEDDDEDDDDDDDEDEDDSGDDYEDENSSSGLEVDDETYIPNEKKISSPLKRQGEDNTDSSTILIKKIKIIPPIPPFGKEKQETFNKEVKVEEIQPPCNIEEPDDKDSELIIDIPDLIEHMQEIESHISINEKFENAINKNAAKMKDKSPKIIVKDLEKELKLDHKKQENIVEPPVIKDSTVSVEKFNTKDKDEKKELKISDKFSAKSKEEKIEKQSLSESKESKNEKEKVKIIINEQKITDNKMGMAMAKNITKEAPANAKIGSDDKINAGQIIINQNSPPENNMTLNIQTKSHKEDTTITKCKNSEKAAIIIISENKITPPSLEKSEIKISSSNTLPSINNNKNIISSPSKSICENKLTVSSSSTPTKILQEKTPEKSKTILENKIKSSSPPPSTKLENNKQQSFTTSLSSVKPVVSSNSVSSKIVPSVATKLILENNKTNNNNKIIVVGLDKSKPMINSAITSIGPVKTMSISEPNNSKVQDNKNSNNNNIKVPILKNEEPSSSLSVNKTPPPPVKIISSLDLKSTIELNEAKSKLLDTNIKVSIQPPQPVDKINPVTVVVEKIKVEKEQEKPKIFLSSSSSSVAAKVERSIIAQSLKISELNSSVENEIVRIVKLPKPSLKNLRMKTSVATMTEGDDDCVIVGESNKSKKDQNKSSDNNLSIPIEIKQLLPPTVTVVKTIQPQSSITDLQGVVKEEQLSAIKPQILTNVSPKKEESKEEESKGQVQPTTTIKTSIVANKNNLTSLNSSTLDKSSTIVQQQQQQKPPSLIKSEEINCPASNIDIKPSINQINNLQLVSIEPSKSPPQLIIKTNPTNSGAIGGGEKRLIVNQTSNLGGDKQVINNFIMNPSQIKVEGGGGVKIVPQSSIKVKIPQQQQPQQQQQQQPALIATTNNNNPPPPSNIIINNLQVSSTQPQSQQCQQPPKKIQIIDNSQNLKRITPPPPLPPPPPSTTTTTTTTILPPSTITNNSSNLKSRPKIKQVKLNRTNSNPPGSINLERSYQICQAVIQNSPNREQLICQLVKPPPPPLTSGIDQKPPTPINPSCQSPALVSDGGVVQIQQQNPITSTIAATIQQQQQQGVGLVGAAATPTRGQNPAGNTNQIQMQMPLLAGHPSHQKVIVIGPGGQGGCSQTLPLIRPVHSGGGVGSPLTIMRQGTPQQIVVSSSNSVGVGNTNRSMAIGLGVGVGNLLSGGAKNFVFSNNNNNNNNSNITTTVSNNNNNTENVVTQMHMQIPLQTNNNLQTQNSIQSTIITPQQLALLIQQQQQQQQQNHPRSAQLPIVINCSTSNRPNSLTRVNANNIVGSSAVQSSLAEHNNNLSIIGNNNNNNAFACSPISSSSSPSSSSSLLSSQNNTLPTASFQIIKQNNSQYPNILHIPVSQNQKQNNNAFPLRAQIITSNGETLTIHRGAITTSNNQMTSNVSPSQHQVQVSSGGGGNNNNGNSPIRQIRQPLNINLAQVKRLPQNYIVTNSGNTLVNNVNVNNSQIQELQSFQLTNSTITLSRQQLQGIASNHQQLRVISQPNTENFINTMTNTSIATATANKTNITLTTSNANNNGNLSLSNSTAMNNLAEYITNQLANNIRPISPLTLENVRLQAERNSPSLFSNNGGNSGGGGGVQVQQGSQVLNVNSINGNQMWSPSPGQIINLNIGPNGGQPRIITTTQPGQHPCISIPDTTQSPNNIGIFSGQEFENIFKVIESGGAKVSRVECNEINNRTGEFAPIENVNKIVAVDSRGNCVCDLRAMIVCRKCGVFCHDDCLDSQKNLCMACAT